MGEPLANFRNVVPALRILLDDFGFDLSRRRVTLSTSGLVPQIYKLAEETNVALAVSLHAPDDALRNELVPINRKHPIAELLDGLLALHRRAERPQRHLRVRHARRASTIRRRRRARWRVCCTAIRPRSTSFRSIRFRARATGARAPRPSSASATSCCSAACSRRCAARAATTSMPPAASSPAGSSIAPRCGSATRSSASRFNHEHTNRSLTWLSAGTVCRSRAAGGLRDECCAGQTQQGRRVLQRPARHRLPEPGRPAAGEGQARSCGEAEPRQRRRAQRARLCCSST